MSKAPFSVPPDSLRGTPMIQGATPDAGKSTLVAGLCRVAHRAGVHVASFKPQNMALNSAITADGGEVGRAQALQVQTAGVVPTIDMNPVLLKPNSDTGAQIIIHGQLRCDLDARAYYDYKSTAMAAVLESHTRLHGQYDLVLVEGTGSPAEINLRDCDVASMGFVEAVGYPVVPAADIDRGGVFAHLTGTLACLSDSEHARVMGFTINRFRGNISLLTPGLDWLTAQTDKPVFGVLPYLPGLHLDAEGAVQTAQHAASPDALRVVTPVLPRVSNHTDFGALRAHPQMDVRLVGPGQPIPPVDLIIPPGSKSVQADLAWLCANGWEAAIARHLCYGGKLTGICGGMQMLGRRLHDPLGLEGAPGSVKGLGYLDFETTLETSKKLRQVRDSLAEGDVAAADYEIHMGVTTGSALVCPTVSFDDGHADGAISAGGQIFAAYLHGLFDTPQACCALLAWVDMGDAQAQDYATLCEASLERLTDTCGAHLDPAALLRTPPRAG